MSFSWSVGWFSLIESDEIEVEFPMMGLRMDDKLSFLKENESTYIPLGSKHRLSNPEDEPLILIEVQSGSYLGEDDIIRFEDIYGRHTI